MSDLEKVALAISVEGLSIVLMLFAILLAIRGLKKP